ncbi:TPA: antirestriction protein ArdR [Pseudomonas aeruginosa]
MATGKLIGTLRATADQWRATNQQHPGGVVLIWGGSVYGWKNCLRDAAHEQPGAYAVDEAGHIFVAEGGDEYNGAKCWVAVTPTN